MSHPPAQQKFIDTAHRLFAERGFHGVSFADVAREHDLTKQSVIYHFGTKRALYGAVLQGVADRLEAVIDMARAASQTDNARLQKFLTSLHQHMQSHQQDARLIARELIDNLDRAERGQTWHLRDFLDAFTDLVRSHPNWSDREADAAAAVAYQMIGAINYFAISDATLVGIWGEARLEGMKSSFLPTLLDSLAPVGSD